MVQLEPRPLPVVPTALKAQAGCEAANPERAPGAGADAAATLGLGHARGPGKAGCLMAAKVNRSRRLPAASGG